MKTSIATVSIPGTFEQKLDAIAAAGFDGIEIFEQDLLSCEFTAREAGRMARERGLDIPLFQPFRDFEGLPEPLRTRAFARAQRKFDLMEELGTDLVLICSSCHPAALGGIDRIADDLAELGEIAAKRGIKVGYEALAWGRHMYDHRDAWEAVRRADHPNVGLILDSFHTLARRIDPQSILRIPGDRIFFVQLADAPALEMDLLYWSRHFRCMLGEGDLDVTGFLSAVLATGYAGPLSLEIFNDQFRQGLPHLLAVDGHRSLVAAMDRIRRTDPHAKVDLPAFPAPATVEGVEYLEFATDDGERDELETYLRQMGFSCTHRHVSKPVSRWSQGEINVLVNTGLDGFSRAMYAAHGTTVSEVALRMPDARAAFERAVAVDAPPFHQPVAAGELEIPAVQSLGGGVMRFIDSHSEVSRIWDVDFLPTGERASRCGLVAVDHVGQTMAYDEMLSWTLFYVALFEARRAPMIDVVDPDGLVRSQALETGRLRVTLNGAAARSTLAGRFVEESVGSSVQHIAFLSDDIFATAEALEARGFPALAIGRNYYGDLDARFGLEPELLSRLQRHNIMYDEDAGGAYYQLYSRPRKDGLFFEIVQRQGDYAGYGAPNAPFRIAAQKRALRR